MEALSVYAASNWHSGFREEEQKSALNDLESGKILFYPQLSFELASEEQSIFLPLQTAKSKKNLSFSADTNCLKGLGLGRLDKKLEIRLKSILSRFSKQARAFMISLFPCYANTIIAGRTSYRPAQIGDRKSSARKDDRRLHIDAFPANPNQGKRILRLFCNINPYGQHRIWRTGETFTSVANRFLPEVSKPIPGSARLLHWLRLTKGTRSLYDHIMLQIHDRMKLDAGYQTQVKSTEIRFPPGSSWIVSTDSVSHAAMSGQYVLEQTFLLPVTAMQNPESAPLRILEGLLSCRLA